MEANKSVEKQPAAYYALIGVSLVFSILAVITLLPNPNASKPNILGYRSVCTFAPAATALCGLLAGITCTIRNRLVSKRAASMRYRPLFIPLGVSAVLIIIAAVSAVRFAAVQSEFYAVIENTAPAAGTVSAPADGTRRAAVSEGEVSATVELTVSGGMITELKLLEGKNVEPRVAETIFAAVKESQSTEVDAVAGATATSNVLLKAIAEAAAAE